VAGLDRACVRRRSRRW